MCGAQNMLQCIESKLEGRVVYWRLNESIGKPYDWYDVVMDVVMHTMDIQLEEFRKVSILSIICKDCLDIVGS